VLQNRSWGSRDFCLRRPHGLPPISHERILQAYPLLEPADIDEALAYAAWRMVEREEVLILS
jgi:hypothetical protein